LTAWEASARSKETRHAAWSLWLLAAGIALVA
jgi:hypothetical protein